MFNYYSWELFSNNLFKLKYFMTASAISFLQIPLRSSRSENHSSFVKSIQQWHCWILPLVFTYLYIINKKKLYWKGFNDYKFIFFFVSFQRSFTSIVVILTHEGLGHKIFPSRFHILITAKHFKQDCRIYNHCLDPSPLPWSSYIILEATKILRCHRIYFVGPNFYKISRTELVQNWRKRFDLNIRTN